MALIEREAALRALDKLQEESVCESDDWEEGVECAYDCIAMQKEVDAVPVRHGYWKIRFFGDRAKCSICGMTFADAYDLEDFDHYCRHCGAVMDSIKMDGKDGNDENA